MLQALLAVVLFLGPMSAGQALLEKQASAETAQEEKGRAGLEAGARADAAGSTTQPATQPTTQPTTQASAAATAEAASDVFAASEESLGRILGKTRVGQLFEGKTRVTLEDVRNPLYWVDTIKDLVLAVLVFIPRLVVAALFLGFFWLIYRGVRRLVLASLGTAGVDPSIRDMLGHMIKWGIMGFGLVIACNQIGIQIAALLTGVSIIGLAVGFAAQETLANFIAGIVIFWDKPFKVGDYVEVEGVFGVVKRVTFRSTRILDGSGQYFVFPNTFMLSKKLSNYTTNPATKVKVDVAIGYRESIEGARQVLLQVIEGDRRINGYPRPEVTVTKYAAAGVELALSFWVPDESISRPLAAEYLEKSKNALDAAGMGLAAPAVPVAAPVAPPAAPPALRAAG